MDDYFKVLFYEYAIENGVALLAIIILFMFIIVDGIHGQKRRNKK